jgi:hypothetical protein
MSAAKTEHLSFKANPTLQTDRYERRLSFAFARPQTVVQTGIATSRRVLAACGGRTRGWIRRAYGPQLSRDPRSTL